MCPRVREGQKSVACVFLNYFLPYFYMEAWPFMGPSTISAGLDSQLALGNSPVSAS